MQDIEDAPTWEVRTPQLLALLAASAPQLQSLDHRYPQPAPLNWAAALPNSLLQLSQLTYLSLDFGRAPVTTAHLDAKLKGLSSLQHLSLSCNKALKGFPLSIVHCCTRLRHLSISDSSGWDDNACVGAVPSDLGQLVGLTCLRLVKVSVSRLPDSVSRLTALCELDLEGNAEPIIPEVLFSLLSLTKLTLGDSMDYSVPEGISRLTGLLQLSIKCQRYTELPVGLVACRLLSRLEMASDPASPVPASLPSLRHLSIRVLPNRLPHVDFWSSLTELVELELHCTKRHPCVVDNLDEMVSLSKLTIFSACLDETPTGTHLRQLESLRLVGCSQSVNMLRCLRDSKKLRELTVKGELLILRGQLVRVLSSLPNLEYLELRKPTAIIQLSVWEAGLVHVMAKRLAKGYAPVTVRFAQQISS